MSYSQAVVLWLPQVARAAGLVALGRTPPPRGLVVTTGLLILSLLLPLPPRSEEGAMTPSFSPVSIRELLVLLALLLYLTDTNVVAAMRWAVTTRPVLWEPLVLAALGTCCFDRIEQRARRAALDGG